jgi:hypothetical protein
MGAKLMRALATVSGEFGGRETKVGIWALSSARELESTTS